MSLATSSGPVILGLLRGHEKIPIAILLDLLLGLIAILRDVRVARVRFTIHARGRGRVVRRNSGGGDRFLVPGRWEGGSGAEMAQKDTGAGR